MNRPKIEVGGKVRVTQGPNAGLVGTVLSIHRATPDQTRRAFIEIDLTDGPHRRVYGFEFLEPSR